MKWRRIPYSPPQVVLEERIGPHVVHIETYKHEGTPMFCAVQIVGNTRSAIGISARSAEHALVVGARFLGYEPDEDA